MTARGFSRNGETRRIVITLDNETFEQVAARAKRARSSFAEEARLLIEWGLEAGQ